MGQRLGTVVFLGVHLDRTGIWLIAVGMPPVQYFWTVGNILAVDEPGSHGNVALFDAAAAGFVHIVVQPRTEGLGCSINIALLHGRCVYRCDAADIGRVPHGELLCDRAAFAVADNVTLAFVNTAQLTAHAGLESLPDVFMFAACGFVGFFGVPTTTVCGFEYEQHQLSRCSSPSAMSIQLLSVRNCSPVTPFGGKDRYRRWRTWCLLECR